MRPIDLLKAPISSSALSEKALIKISGMNGKKENDMQSIRIDG